MKRHILLYGLVGGVLIALLKWIEYRYLVMEHSFEIYGGRLAALFAGVGVWLGLKITKTKETVVVKEVAVPCAARQPAAHGCLHGMRGQILGEAEVGADCGRIQALPPFLS